MLSRLCICPSIHPKHRASSSASIAVSVSGPPFCQKTAILHRCLFHFSVTTHEMLSCWKILKFHSQRRTSLARVLPQQPINPMQSHPVQDLRQRPEQFHRRIAADAVECPPRVLNKHAVPLVSIQQLRTQNNKRRNRIDEKFPIHSPIRDRRTPKQALRPGVQGGCNVTSAVITLVWRRPFCPAHAPYGQNGCHRRMF